MSKRMLLLVALVIVSLMAIFETVWVSESAWGWFIEGILALASVTLFHLFTAEAAIKVKPLQAVILVCGIIILVGVTNLVFPDIYAVKKFLGISEPQSSTPFPEMPKFDPKSLFPPDKPFEITPQTPVYETPVYGPLPPIYLPGR